MAVRQCYTVWWVYILSVWLLATSGLASAAQPEGILLGKQIKISAHAFNLNRKTGHYETKLVLSNTSKQKKTLYGPLTLVISGADQTGLNVVNASGTTTTGLPYLTIALPDTGFNVGSKVSGIALIVNNPGKKKKFKLRYALYGFFAPYQPDNKPPAMIQLIGVSSISGDSLSAEWLPTTDDQTPANQLVYTMHVSDTEGFTPSLTTAKLTGTAITSGTIQHLSPASRYYVKVAAMDNQGLESWSNELSLSTADIGFKRSAAKVHVPSTLSSPQVTATAISYTSATTPKVGEFLVGSTDGGYLRKVTAVHKRGNQITATTEPASLNQVFKDLDINTTIKLEPLPTMAPTQASIQSMSLATRAKKNQRVMRWPQTGLTLIDNQVSTLPVMSPFAAAVQNAQTTGVNGSQQTTTGIYTDFSGPASVAITPGTASIFTVNALVSKPFIDQAINIPLKVCSIRSLGLTHDDPAKRILLNNEQNPALLPQFGTMQPNPADQYASLTTEWSPDAKYVHDGGLPYYASYEVTVGEYAKTTGSSDCGSTLFNYSGWRDKLTIKVPIYITMGDIPPKETKSLTFSSDLKITDNLTFGVKPDFDIAARIRNFQLLDATLAVNADIEFQNELLIQGNTGATLDQTLEVLAPRKFVRVFTAGPVPIVVSGEFGMNLRVQGKAAGTVNLGEVIRYAFPQTRFGLTYQNGQWNEISNFQPEYQFTIKGDGNAGAELTLTLVPDLQIHFYDAASGRMLVEPYLYAQANIHGNFLYQDGSGNPLPYVQLPDYWFTDLQGGGGVDLSLYAGLHIFDYNVASYPVGVTVNQTDLFKKVAAIPKTAIAAMPKLSAVVDYTVKPATGSDTRAVLIKGQFQELSNPFKGLFGLNPDPFANPYVRFNKWTEPKVFTSQRAAKVVSDLTVEPDAFWLNYVEPGSYRVRISGESDLGYFVRLVAEDPNLGQDQGISVEIVLTDNDQDGMVDQWESQWGVDDPAADPDQDLATNLDEFKAGTNPIIADPGQRLAVSVTGDGSVSSTPTGNSGGILDCRATSGICMDSFDLPMGTTITLTATAGNGSQFVGWSGADGGGCPVPQAGAVDGSCTLTLDGKAKSISAQFDVIQTNTGTGYTAYAVYPHGGILSIDTTTNSVTDIFTSQFPNDFIVYLGITPDGKRLYVSTENTPPNPQRILVFNTSSHAIDATIDFGDNITIRHLEVGQSGRYLYVNFSSTASPIVYSALVIDTTTNNVVRTFNYPILAISPDETYFYAFQGNDDTKISKIDLVTGTVLSTFSLSYVFTDAKRNQTNVIWRASEIAIMPDGVHAYVTGASVPRVAGDTTVALKINTATNALSSNLLSSHPQRSSYSGSIVLSPNGQRAALLDSGGILSINDTNNNVFTPITYRSESYMTAAFTPNGKTLYEAYPFGSITVYDAVTGAVLPYITGIPTNWNTATSLVIRPYGG